MGKLAIPVNLLSLNFQGYSRSLQFLFFIAHAFKIFWEDWPQQIGLYLYGLVPPQPFLGKRQARGIPTNGNALGPCSGSLQTWTRVQNLSSLRWALKFHAPRHPVLPSALYFTTRTRSFPAFTGSFSHTACAKCRHEWGVYWCASRNVWRRCGCLAGGHDFQPQQGSRDHALLHAPLSQGPVSRYVCAIRLEYPFPLGGLMLNRV